MPRFLPVSRSTLRDLLRSVAIWQPYANRASPSWLPSTQSSLASRSILCLCLTCYGNAFSWLHRPSMLMPKKV
jgi:hypothetical protein